MAQTKRKRRTKHRGNAAGVVTSRGRTSAPPKGEEAKQRQKAQAREKRSARYDRPPSWKSSIQRAALTCVLLFAVLMIIPGAKHSIAASLVLAAVAFAFYVPMGYMIDQSLYRRRQKRKADQGK